MRQWCLGFVFNPARSHVLLLRKGRTLHVKLWNGMGGNLEGEESPAEAMEREGKEESSKDITGWEPIGTIGDEAGTWLVHVYATTHRDVLDFRPINVKKPLAGLTGADIWADDRPGWVALSDVKRLPLAPHAADFIDFAAALAIGTKMEHPKLELREKAP